MMLEHPYAKFWCVWCVKNQNARWFMGRNVAEWIRGAAHRFGLRVAAQSKGLTTRIRLAAAYRQAEIMRRIATPGAEGG
jgi:hypothetical protein